MVPTYHLLIYIAEFPKAQLLVQCLFLVYIKDFHDSVFLFNYAYFAVNSTAYIPHSNLNLLFIILGHEYRNVSMNYC